MMNILGNNTVQLIVEFYGLEKKYPPTI